MNIVINVTMNSQINTSCIRLHFQTEPGIPISPACQILLYWTTHILPRIILNSVRQHNHFLLKVFIRLHVSTVD